VFCDCNKLCRGHGMPPTAVTSVEWFHINPRPWNDLLCVEWDVKLIHTYFTLTTLRRQLEH